LHSAHHPSPEFKAQGSASIGVTNLFSYSYFILAEESLRAMNTSAHELDDDEENVATEDFPSASEETPLILAPAGQVSFIFYRS